MEIIKVKDSMKALNKGKIKDINEDLIFPMIIWSSGYVGNASVCQKLNRNVFYINKHLTTLILSIGIKPTNFIPYPYSDKSKDKVFDMLKTYLVNEFKFGKSDISSLNNIILNITKDKKLSEEFSQRYGLDNKERKMLGLKPIKFVKPKMKVDPKPKQGFDLSSF